MPMDIANRKILLSNPFKFPCQQSCLVCLLYSRLSFRYLYRLPNLYLLFIFSLILGCGRLFKPILSLMICFMQKKEKKKECKLFVSWFLNKNYIMLSENIYIFIRGSRHKAKLTREFQNELYLLLIKSNTLSSVLLCLTSNISNIFWRRRCEIKSCDLIYYEQRWLCKISFTRWRSNDIWDMLLYLFYWLWKNF